MRVAEERDAVGGELQNLIDGVGKSVRRLVWEAIDQVDVDAVEAESARGEEQVARHFEWLNAMHGFLHFSAKVLNANAETVEPELAQSFEMLARGYARVNLDADLTVGIKMKMFFRKSE